MTCTKVHSRKHPKGEIHATFSAVACQENEAALGKTPIAGVSIDFPPGAKAETFSEGAEYMVAITTAPAAKPSAE